MKRNNNKNRGFTLIEILIVVAIIAILSSVVLIGLGPTQQAGRDARRLSDLHEVQNGLELYFSKCGFYPGTGACGTAATAGYGTYTAGAYTDMALALTTAGVGANTVPLDPTNSGTHVYRFRTNGASATTYLLSAVLENASGTVFTSYVPPPVGTYTNGDTLNGACASPEFCLTL